MRPVFSHIISLLLLLALLQSCNGRREFSTSKRRYNNGYYVTSKKSLPKAGYNKQEGGETAVAALVPAEIPGSEKNEVAASSNAGGISIQCQHNEQKAEAHVTADELRLVGRTQDQSATAMSGIGKRKITIKNTLIRYPHPAKKENKKRSLSDNDENDLLYGILFLVGGLFCAALAYYYLYIAAAAPYALLVALLLIIGAGILFSIGSYMIRNSLGLGNLPIGCSPFGGFWL